MQSFLENGLRLEVVHASKLSLLAERGLRVARQANYVRLHHELVLLLEELPDEDCRLEPVAEGHAVVHKDECIGLSLPLIALGDEVDSLTSI